mmetsp:Transcript_22473/g.57314  ORF Transcript_22473/g.57314 Transcript_22473/m.57314 type:complete len:296 (+) Transcript_22473:97-984(+)
MAESTAVVMGTKRGAHTDRACWTSAARSLPYPNDGCLDAHLASRRATAARAQAALRSPRAKRLALRPTATLAASTYASTSASNWPAGCMRRRARSSTAVSSMCAWMQASCKDAASIASRSPATRAADQLGKASAGRAARPTRRRSCRINAVASEQGATSRSASSLRPRQLSSESSHGRRLPTGAITVPSPPFRASSRSAGASKAERTGGGLPASWASMMRVSGGSDACGRATIGAHAVLLIEQFRRSASAKDGVILPFLCTSWRKTRPMCTGGLKSGQQLSTNESTRSVSWPMRL